MATNEPLEDLIIRRNRRLIKFFVSNGFNVRLAGDEQKPAVVLDETRVLSCFVKNFDLYFTKIPFGDEVVKQFKLKNEPEVTREEIQEVIDLCHHRPVYKVRIKGTNLFLIGFNYLNSDECLGRYPVFARHRPKIYFDIEFAEKMIQSLNEENYNLEII